ncbi:MAG: glycine cleavage T C-terminal barrel domain-containing protein [Planctomycetota bacterium]|nr:glycine cleavage T C-terminal barrel domain-containing protein [Planctomycetota bacterium]
MIVRRDDRRWVRVVGADRADYLHRMLTQDVMGIGPAHVRPACLLTPKGRIVADLLIWNASTHYWLNFPTAAEAAIPTLEKYVILEDTAFEPSDDVRIDLVGPDAATALEQAGLSVPAATACREGELGGGPVHVLHLDLGRRTRYVLKVPAENAAAAIAAIDLPEGDLAALEVARIEEGVPAYGPELGEDVLFNEAGLQDTVSWSKGCFPGQEPVVMALDRGHAPRCLCVLAAEGDAVPETGVDLVHEAKRVGTLTSATYAPHAGGVRALGYVRHALAHVGTELETPAGDRVRIVRVRRLVR